MKPHYAILMILSSFIACKTSTSVSSPTEVEVRSNHQYAFPKDTYHFHLSQTSEKVLYISNHDQTNPKKVALYLENLKEVGLTDIILPVVGLITISAYLFST